MLDKNKSFIDSLSFSALGLSKFIKTKISNSPKLINLEVTKLCNARCDFCDYWQTRNEERLDNYTDLIKKIDPLVVMVTGGEPMLRKDIVDIIKQIKSASFFTYTGIITKGDLLNMDKASKLYKAGIDQIAISLDFLGDRHSENRGVKGLWDHISKLIPEISKKLKRTISINTIIMDDNLDEITNMARQAKEWGANISFSSYSVMKANNDSHFVKDEVKKVENVINELISLKKQWKDTIVSSDYYLGQIPEFFKKGYGPECNAGSSFITVTPDGFVKRCSEMPAVCHYTDYKPGYFTKTDCATCWFGCRGETQAPILAKGKELIGL